MPSLDAAGGSGAGVLAVAALLGLRHAADPDHLVAVTALVARAGENRTRTAARLGALWGLGHALTLLLFGLPVVLWGVVLPEAMQRAAEFAIGVVIVVLGLQLLLRWHHGAYHVHEHDHDGRRHVHVHAHAGAAHHGHVHPPRRSPRASFLVGCLHGTGGSAAVGLLLIGSIGSRGAAIAALLIFASATAVSMAALSAAFGLTLARGGGVRSPGRVIPLLGGSNALFGVWYALAAISLMPYPL
jgi:hypothetical protein